MFGKKKTKSHILLVDNFDQVRQVTQSVLESSGYSVSAVPDVGEAFVILGKKKVDLIISEVELAGLGGIGFYHRLKKHNETKEIPFIFVTAYDAQKLQKEIQGQDLIIPKPVRWKEFTQRLEAMLSQSGEAIASTSHAPSQPRAEKRPEPPMAGTKTIEKRPASTAKPDTDKKVASAGKKTLPPMEKSRPTGVTKEKTTALPKERTPSRPVREAKKTQDKLDAPQLVGEKKSKPGAESKKAASKKSPVALDKNKPQPSPDHKKAPSSRDTLQTTAARAVPQRLEISYSEEDVSGKKKRKLPMVLLPEGRATHHFSHEPTGFFHFKQIREALVQTLKAFRSGKSSPVAPFPFPTMGQEWITNLQFALARQVERPSHPELAIAEDELMLDVSVEETTVLEEAPVPAHDDETIIAELPLESQDTSTAPSPESPVMAMPRIVLGHKAKAAASETVISLPEVGTADSATIHPYLACIQKNTAPFSFAGNTPFAWLEAKTDTWHSSLSNQIDKQKVIDACTTVFSMAGLCFQMLTQDFEISYVRIETEAGALFFVQDEANQNYGIAIVPES